jgi:PmbA protein
MDPQQALEFICKEAGRRGAQHFDAFAGESESIGLELFEGRVKNTEISSSRGIGVRLFIDDKPGYAYTERFSRNALEQTITDAVAHTRLTGPLKLEIPEPQSLPDFDLELWNAGLEAIELDLMKSLGLKLEDIALSADKRVKNVPYLGVGRNSAKTWIQNSRGIRYAAQGNSGYAGLGVLAIEGASKKMGVYSNSTRLFEEFDPGYMAGTAVERAVELLGGRPIKSGQYPVILSNRISPQIFSMYSSSYFAEVVQKGQSKLEGLLHTKIASENLNITCDPHIRGYPGSRLFDGEGIISKRMEIVSQGVLNTYLYNLESAMKENRMSTGHASRGYSGQVGTGYSNMMVEKGNSTLSELLDAYPRCLYVTNLEGNSGCSAVSGEISIGIQGFWIENGRRVHPVEGVTVSSNYFDIIKNITGISDSYSDLLSSVKVPDILVESMYVAG